MATLPLEIVFTCILPRLPVKTLNRFKCVSKSFRSEISSPNFVKLQHLTALSSDVNRFLVFLGRGRTSRYKGLYMYDLDSLHGPPSFIPLPKSSMVVASCECYLLVSYRYVSSGKFSVILINPSMRTYHQLPYLVVPSVSQTVQYGLCHCWDDLGDDFKVVRFVDFLDCNTGSLRRQVMVYSSRTGFWKLIECTTRNDYISTYHFRGVFCRHMLHVIHVHIVDHQIKKIGCFDIKAEQWGPDVPLPDIHLDVVNLKVTKPFDLGVLDDQLCYLVQNVNDLTYDLWVMRNYGVKESWVKMMSICISDLPPPLPWETMDILFPRIAYHPLTCRKGSPHELLYKRDHSFKLFWYNIEDKESIEAEFPGLPSHGASLAYVCKGSMLNVPGGELITASCLEEERRLC
ncbi:hypothetical protein vseg_016268 [Gypsophila vaccaria]